MAAPVSKLAAGEFDSAHCACAVHQLIALANCAAACAYMRMCALYMSCISVNALRSLLLLQQHNKDVQNELKDFEASKLRRREADVHCPLVFIHLKKVKDTAALF